MFALILLQETEQPNQYNWPIVIVFFIVGFFIYFLPSFIGRKKKNALGIFLLNLFLGITFVGWVVALVWSVTKDKN
jgi:threonine/homoserine/homoserine lactone efflux protein